MTYVNVRANGYAVSRDLAPKLVAVATLKPLGHETRKHPAYQIRKLAQSLEEFGFVLPILVNRENCVVHGWGLVLAARKLELPEIPAISVSDLSEAKLRLLRLALNHRVARSPTHKMAWFQRQKYNRCGHRYVFSRPKQVVECRADL